MNRSFKRSLSFSLVLILMSFSSSCVINKKNAVQRAFAESQQHMGAGNYQEAINSYDVAYTRYPNETHVRENYIRTVEKMKRSADTAYDTKKYDLSEEIYSVLSKSFSNFKTFEKSLSFNKAYLDRKIKNCRIAQIEIQAQNALAVGNYSGALDIYKTTERSYPEDALLQEKLLGTVSEIYQVAEGAQTDQNYIMAGKVYSFLSKNFQILKKSMLSLPFTEDSLQERVRNCRSALTGKGLELYRKGKLKEAINVWEGILQFDPDNIEIKKAIENAKAQLKKIKK
jgi:tetratricopeptide (TPR) repeat protein